VVDDVVTHATEERAPESAQAASSGDDEIGALLLGGVHDLFPGFPWHLLHRTFDLNIRRLPVTFRYGNVNIILFR